MGIRKNILSIFIADEYVFEVHPVPIPLSWYRMGVMRRYTKSLSAAGINPGVDGILNALDEITNKQN